MRTYEELIFENVEMNLGAIPFHNDIPGIRRLAPRDFPTHTAIHSVSLDQSLPEDYVVPHIHAVPEINIFIPTDSTFHYEVQLGEETYSINGPRTIWIPAGLLHAANVKCGYGFFVCIILDSSENVFGI